MDRSSEEENMQRGMESNTERHTPAEEQLEGMRTTKRTNITPEGQTEHHADRQRNSH